MEYMRGRKSVLYVLPTGGGKTVIFSHIAERAAVLGNRICVLVHRQELVDQTSRTLHEIGVDHGVIASGYRMDLSRGVQVASVQTLARRLHQVPAGFFQLLIVDEAHHAVAGSWAKVLSHYGDAKILGVTATPERLDGRGLGDKFESMICGPQAAWLTDQGFLAPCKTYIPPGMGKDWSGAKHRAGDIDMAEAAREIMAGPDALAGPVKQYLRFLEGSTAIAFCCTVEHAQFVADGFNAAGIPAAVLDGSMDKARRRGLIQQLSTGAIKVLSSCMVISEGTDVPSVGGCILLRPTDSLSLHLQQVGRCLRPAPGKSHAVVLDHVGNTLKHGFVTDPRDWSLEGRKKRSASKAPSVKDCPGCMIALPSATAVCPECGHVFNEATGRALEQVDGNVFLVEFGEKERRRFEAEERTKKRKELAQCRTLEELQALGEQRGYKPGWAHHIWRSREQRRYGGQR